MVKTEFNSKIYKPRAGTQLSLQTLGEGRELKKDARGESETERLMLGREQCLLGRSENSWNTNKFINGIFLKSN